MLGNIRFRLITSDCGDTINKLCTTDFCIKELRCEKDCIISGIVQWYDFGELEAFAYKNNLKLENIEKRGIVFKGERYKRRLGIIVGLVISIAIVFLFSNIVLKIEIYGNESVSDEHVKMILSDYGIKIGTFIPSLDIRSLEQEILTAFDSFRWIGIRSSGCRILVDISELTEKPEIIPQSSPCNIIASRDAQIVDIRNVYMGMLVPMLYDGVKKGDILISGTIDGKLDHDYPVHAMGEIIGRYKEEISFEQSYFDNIINYGGKQYKKSIFLFGIRIPLYLNKSTDFDYEYSEKTEYLQFLGLELPIGLIEAEIKPYTVDDVEYSAEQTKLLLEEKIKLYEKNFLQNEEITVISKEVDFKEQGDKMTVNVKYCLESDIGIEQQIFIKR